MVDLLRAQVTLAHVDGLPRDNVSMNYWFSTDDATVAAATDVATKVRDLFTAAVAPRGNALYVKLGAQVGNVGHTVKVYEYDMATGARLSYDGAPPLATLGFSFSAGPRSGVGEALPSEVACCVSFRNLTGATPGGGNFATPLAQRRGRVFVGPMQIDVTAPDGTGVPRPTADLIDYLLAPHSLLPLGNDAVSSWVVYSRPFAGRPETPRPGRPTLPELPARSGQAYIIEQVSVDNAWDTQRRRGERATARTFG